MRLSLPSSNFILQASFAELEAREIVKYLLDEGWSYDEDTKMWKNEKFPNATIIH